MNGRSLFLWISRSWGKGGNYVDKSASTQMWWWWLSYRRLSAERHSHHWVQTTFSSVPPPHGLACTRCHLCPVSTSSLVDPASSSWNCPPAKMSYPCDAWNIMCDSDILVTVTPDISCMTLISKSLWRLIYHEWLWCLIYQVWLWWLIYHVWLMYTHQDLCLGYRVCAPVLKFSMCDLRKVDTVELSHIYV